MTKLLLIALLTAAAATAQSQVKGRFYAGIGYHRIFFTKSTIHFRDSKTGNYHFTLYHVKSKDDNDLKIGKGQETPQFTVLAGYRLTNNTAIELHYDHAKYMVVQDQTVRIKGRINEGQMDKDTVLSKDFIQYEHTHGANHFMINYVKTSSFSKKSGLVMKPGAGVAVPHSDNRTFGNSGSGKYHLAGFIVAFDVGWNYSLMKHVFLQLSLKTAYALYADVLLYGEGRARQHWFSLQPILVAGYK